MSPSYAAPLDAVDELIDFGETVLATKHIVRTDPYLAGHYPHLTIYPGVFSIETVDQAARSALIERGGPGTTVELTGIGSVSFSAPLLPGDTLHATLRLLPSPDDPERVVVKARCARTDGRPAARITLHFTVHAGLKLEPTDA